MSKSSAAARAASSNSPNEVNMALISSIVRAPKPDTPDIPLRSTLVDEVLLKRDGEPDLIIENGRLLLTIETMPRGTSPQHPNKRWKVWRLYQTYRTQTPLDTKNMSVDEFNSAMAEPPVFKPRRLWVVAEEGHSSMEGERVRYSAKICDNEIQIWEALGKLDELKEPMAELGLSVVQKI